MGIYARLIFPRLCDLFLNQPSVTRLRRELLAHAQGRILEIGFGTGLNLACYPAHVQKLTTVDPNPGMHQLARRRLRRSRIQVDHQMLSGERLAFGQGAFDCVVSTFTLCSIDRVDLALAEIYRVLKLGGRFLFLEHGLSPEPTVQRWQRRLNWLEGVLADGCRLTRHIGALAAAPGFTSVEIDEFYLQGVPRTHGYLYRGVATK